MKRLGVAMLSGGVLCLASSAQAALSEADFLADLPVVLTVSRMSQPLQDSPASVTIIDQDMIRASGFHDIPDLLRLVPGFSVGYTRDNTFAVGYHGFADAYSRRFQVLVDGRSIYSPNFGEVNWGTLPLAMEDIERIEVVRGPDAAVYGANAFFAIINIISKDPSTTRGKMVSVLAGEQNTAGATLRYGGGEGDLRYRISLSRQHRDRFERAFETNEYYERSYTSKLNGRWDVRLSNTDQISAQIGLADGNWNAGQLEKPDEPRASDPRSGFAQLRFERVTSVDEEWKVQFSHSYADRGVERYVLPWSVTKPIIYNGDKVVDGNARQWRTQLDFSSMRRLNADLRLVWGGELRHEAVQSFGSYGTEDTLDGVLGNLFAHAEWHPAKDWLVQGGTQIGHHYFTGFEVSPRLAVSYQISPHQTLRWAASRASRAPTFFEEKGNRAAYNSSDVLLDRDVIPSEGLKAEVNTSVEFGYVGQWPAWGGQLDVRVYRDHVTNFIGDLRASDDPLSPYEDGLIGKGKFFQYANGGTLDVAGADAQLVWKPHRDFSLHLTQSVAHIKASADIVDDDLPESAPDWTTSLLANWRFAPGWNASAMVYHTDRMMWLSDGDHTKGYTRADFKLARQFKLDGVQAEWALGVQNLGDDYTEFRRQNVFTQRAYTTLRFDW